MAGMAGYDWKWLEMARNGWKWIKWPKMTGIAGMAENG